MAIIQIKNISKVYNTTAVPVYALTDVNLEIDKQEFTAIVGPSGSGKTTLLNILGGLDTPTSGEVIIDDQNITGLPSKKMIDFRLNHIGFVFQSYNLIPVFTAKENIEFIQLLQNIEKKERDERAMELLEAVGIADRADSRPNQLSGGQQQRVAVARALASKPSFVLADEPTANLDSEATNDLLTLMENLNKEYEMTFVFATHDQRVIDRARRVVTLQDGKIFTDKHK